MFKLALTIGTKTVTLQRDIPNADAANFIQEAFEQMVGASDGTETAEQQAKALMHLWLKTMKDEVKNKRLNEALKTAEKDARLAIETDTSWTEGE